MNVCTFSILLCLFPQACEGFVKVDVNTTRGPLFGYHFNQGNDTTKLYYGEADVFLGIPYVLPPVENLRFAKPQKVNAFPGSSPYNATYYRAMCPQPNQHASEIDEDCLYLNVYSPNVKSTEKYPVMVFIHGGSLRIGSNRIDLAGITRNFVSREVVVVSIQYRLDLLGFFTTFTDDFPPNLGMLDQVAALKFINEEISNFGGDPSRITIWGQSAGAASVSAHTYSPLSRNLFQQVIQESGSVLTCFEGALGPTNINFAYANKLCGITEDQWNARNYTHLKECLMKLNFSHNYLDFDKGAGNAICWNMVEDNYFMPDVPRNLWQARPNHPAIIGTNKDEYASSGKEPLSGFLYQLLELRNMRENTTKFTDYSKGFFEKELGAAFASFLGNQSKKCLNTFEQIYTQGNTKEDDHMAWLQAYVDVKTAAFFTGVVPKDIEYYLRNNNSNVFVYEFTWSTLIDQKYEIPGWKPVPHGSEVSLVFMTSAAWDAAIKSGTVTETDYRLADFFGKAWTNFGKYGNPMPFSTPNDVWSSSKSIETTSMEYFEIGQTLGMRQGYRTLDRIEFDQVLPILLGTLPVEMPDYNNGSTIEIA